MTTTALGEAMTIRQVAELLGCSAWTVRQRHIPKGLPHFRTGPSGRFTFFREQVIGWVLAQQQHTGGNLLVGTKQQQQPKATT
jgi:excisionase family DNA binding protein